MRPGRSAARQQDEHCLPSEPIGSLVRLLEMPTLWCEGEGRCAQTQILSRMFGFSLHLTNIISVIDLDYGR